MINLSSPITQLSGRVPEFCDRGHAAEERRPEDQVGAVRVCRDPGRVRRLHLQRSVRKVADFEFIASVKMCIPGPSHQDSSATSATSLTSMIPKTVPPRFSGLVIILLFFKTNVFPGIFDDCGRGEKSHEKAQQKRRGRLQFIFSPMLILSPPKHYLVL